MKRSKFSKAWLIIIAIVVLGGGGAAAYYLTDSFGSKEKTSPSKAAKKKPNKTESSEELLQKVVDGKTKDIIRCTFDMPKEKPNLQHAEVYIKDSSTMLLNQGDNQANILLKDKKAYAWGDGVDMEGLEIEPGGGIIVTFDPNAGYVDNDVSRATDQSGFISPEKLAEAGKKNSKNNDITNIKCSVAKDVDTSIFSHPNGIVFKDMTAYGR